MCVNPGHLFLGTQADNMSDKVSKGRQQKGSRMWCAKLNDEKVLDILNSYVGGESAISLAARYGVDGQTIKDIFRRKTWKHVPWDDTSALAKTRSENMRFSKKAYVSESQAKEAVKRRAAGESYKLIASEIGVCAETLKRAVRRIAAEGGQSNAWDHPKRRDKIAVIVT
jgi:DNA invertase Pin-like site-specific DNA recombinase